MSRLVFDLETNGLLFKATKIHCVSTLDIDSGKTRTFDNTQIHEAITHLSNATLLIGHNISGFDVPILEKFSDGFSFTRNMHDTLVMSRMFYFTDLRDEDFKAIKMGFPKNLVGAHSLEAWGYRLNLHKDTFGKTTDWTHYSPEMLDYCERDTFVTFNLYKTLLKEFSHIPIEAVQTESIVNYVLTLGHINGIGFDEVKAAQLYGTLMEERDLAEQDLKKLIKPKTVSMGLFTPKRDNKKLGYKEGCQIEKLKIIEFNPRSTNQIADRLTTEYGWVPTEFTETGSPKVTETILETLPFKPVPALIKFKTASKLIAQLAEGRVPWLKLVTNGKIHGTTTCTGARTGRMSHQKPNMAQIPSRKDVRSLFKPPTPGWLLFDTDLSGIELRVLAHYLYKMGNSDFIHEVSTGDPHKLFMQWTGIQDRNNQKEFTYALIYGAGLQKLGSLISKDATQADGEIRTEEQAQTLGINAVSKIKRNLKGYNALQNKIASISSERGAIKLLDGRQVKTAGEHSALNTLIQGSASVILKYWIKQTLILLEDSYLNDHVNFLAAIHDELLFEIDTHSAAEDLENTLHLALSLTVEDLKIKCGLASNSFIGTNWSEVH